MINFLKTIVFCTLFFSTAIFSAPAIWNGSADVSWYEEEAQAYNLINAEQLAGLAKLVNEGTSDFEGKTITLGANIFLNDTTGAGDSSWYSKSHRIWTPIGTASHPFKGEFDGIAGKNNRKIYGLYINNPTSDYMGFFGYTSNVKISNLDIFVGEIIGKNRAGSLVGYAAGGTITNVHTEVDVNGNNSVGGIVGYFTGNISKSSGTGSVVGQDSVGGLAGFITGAISGTATSNSFFVGKVSGRKYIGGLAGLGKSISYSYSESSIEGQSDYIGGLVGFATAVISNSFHSNGVVSGINYVGGLVGRTSSSVEDSYSLGNIYAKENYVGGLIGSSYHVSKYTTEPYITKNSYFVGDVVGKDYVGGLVGFDSLTVPNVDRLVKKVYMEGNVSGENYVGGILGGAVKNVGISSDTGIVYIDSSYHTNGDIIGLLDGVGGVAGSFYGIIAHSYNKSLVKGASYVGGVAGSGKYIESSYAEGFIVGKENYVGGVTGYAKKINDSYHIEGDVEGNSYVGGLAGSCDSILSSYSEGRIAGLESYVGGVAGTSYSIKLSHHQNGDVSGKNYVGGLVGNAKFSDQIGGISNAYHENGDIRGTAYIGGLVGESRVPVASSHSKGNVTGSGNYIGGLIGYFYRKSDTLRISVNSSNNISGSYSLGNVEGKDYVGGLIGSVYRSVKTTGVTSIDSGFIKNSRFVGNVKGQDYVGGLVGSVEIYKQLSRNQKNDYSGSPFLKRYSSLIKNRIINSKSNGNVEGRSNVGGLIGRQAAHCDSSDKYISETYIVFNVQNSSHSDGSVVGKDYVGGLIGVSLGAVDTAFHMNGNVSGYSYAGGLIGQAVGPVTKSFSEGNVSGTGNKVGGLVGFTSNSIKDSYSMGSVLGNDSIGGLAGYVGGPITNSYATASFVKGQNSVGGLVGYAQDLLKSCYFEGDSAIGIYQVGGLAGYVKKSVENSYSSVYVKGDDNVGGLIGSAYGSISNSYAIGNVDGDVEHSSAGNDNLGGLVGYQYGGSISKSLALGDVSGTTKLGGLVGRFEGTSISQSYANGNVTGDYYGDPADEVGNYYIGGLVGYAKGSLAEVYASGSVKGIEDGPVYTGCIVGYVNGSLDVSKSYYDKTKCDLGIDGGENAVTVTGSPEKTTAEMQMQSTFVDWDFTNTWKIMEGTYPFLLIYANSIANAVVSTESLDGFVYDGNEKAPSVTSVSLFGETLILGTDYTVSYTNNVNAGDATIKVCGTGSFSGCKNTSFKIKPISIIPTISTIANVKYDGNEQKPIISVYNGETLLDVSSYSVTFSNNVNAGTGKVEISLTGNYSGSAQAEFIIEKATPIIKTKPSASDVTLGEALSTSVLNDGIADVEGMFAWTTPETIPTLENDGYEVVFIPKDSENYETTNPIVIPVKVIEKFSVVVKVGSQIVDETLIPKGDSYTLPINHDSTGYDFAGWYRGEELFGLVGDVVSVVENIEITARYTPKKYTITFANYNGKSLQEIAVDYDAIPEYTGSTPSRPATTGYTYTFAKWKPSIEKVSGEATYTAVYDSVVNEYTIVFVDDDGTVLKTSSVAYGTKPAAPSDPTKEPTAQYTYTFAGWSPTITYVYRDASYKATYNKKTNYYTITFVDDNGTVLKKSSVAYGTKPAAPTNPSKASTEKFDYTFVGWSPSVTSVTGEATYTAVYDSSDVIYMVTFANYDGTTLQESGLKYNEKPVYSGEAPSKSSTAQYTYKFKGWDSEIVEVRGAKTYNAVYDSTIRSYSVTYKNGTTSLQTGTLEYGTKPAYKGLTPTKSSTVKYTYTFAGWSPTEVAVTGDATYQAVFDSTVRTYNVVFMNGEDELQSSKVAYGFVPSYTGANPKKDSTDKFVYTFSGWAPKLVEVTGEATYQAVFDSSLRQFVISFKNGTTTLQSTLLSYGETPTCGEIPTKASTAQYTYKFVGWNPEVADVTKAATYVAKFDSTIRSYDVVFALDGVALQEVSLKYGSVPEYTGAIPTKESTVQYAYKFKGWDSEVVEVSGAKTYNAVFDSINRSYEIAFVNGSENLQSSTVEYGASPKFLGTTPTKESSVAYTYTFKGWTPTVSGVVGNQTYTAVFDSTIRKYKVSFKNNGTLLQTNMLEYGSTPVYGESEPTRVATDAYAYVFAGWSPKLEKVVTDIDYEAVFDSTLKSYTVSFQNDQSTLLTINVSYGTIPEYTGGIPEKQNSAQYSYTFAGWTPELAPVTKNTTYRAVFDSISVTGFNAGLVSPKFSIMAIGRNIQIAGARVGAAYALFDMQGRVLHKGLVSEANFNLPVPASGNYLMRVGLQIQKVNVK